MRPIVSTGPPAAYGTTMVTARRAGQSCASAGALETISASTALNTRLDIGVLPEPDLGRPGSEVIRIRFRALGAALGFSRLQHVQLQLHRFRRIAEPQLTVLDRALQL